MSLSLWRLFLYLYLINSLQQFLHINVCIDLLGQRHSTRMTDDLLNKCRRYLFLGHHRDAGVTGIMRLVSAANQFHNRCPVGIIVVAVDELLAVGSMEQILVAVLVPLSGYIISSSPSTLPQSRSGIVHFLDISVVARYKAFKSAVSLGNTLLCLFRRR